MGRSIVFRSELSLSKKWSTNEESDLGKWSRLDLYYIGLKADWLSIEVVNLFSLQITLKWALEIGNAELCELPAITEFKALEAIVRTKWYCMEIGVTLGRNVVECATIMIGWEALDGHPILSSLNATQNIPTYFIAYHGSISRCLQRLGIAFCRLCHPICHM